VQLRNLLVMLCVVTIATALVGTVCDVLAIPHAVRYAADVLVGLGIGVLMGRHHARH